MAQLFDHTVVAKQMQRTDHDQGVVGAALLQSRFQFRQPSIVAQDIDPPIQRRIIAAEFHRHLTPQRVCIAFAPVGVHLQRLFAAVVRANCNTTKAICIQRSY